MCPGQRPHEPDTDARGAWAEDLGTGPRRMGVGVNRRGQPAPAVGRVLAQEALSLPTDVPLAPYALERFRGGRLLTGSYGSDAVS